MTSKNIFYVRAIFIFPPDGGLAAGHVKEGKIKVGMQTEINGKVLEATSLQVGDEVKNESGPGPECGFLFVCKGIAKGEIKEGQDLIFREPEEE